MLAAALAALVSGAASADGQLDSTFNTNGVVTIAFPAVAGSQAPRGYLYGAQPLANGTIAAAGFEQPVGLPTSMTASPRVLVMQLSSGGSVTTTSTIPQVALNGPRGTVIGSHSGHVLVAGSNVDANGWQNAAAAWKLAANNGIVFYRRPAAASTDQSICLGAKPVLDDQLLLVAACAYGDVSGPLKLAVMRLIMRTQGRGTITYYSLVPDPAFGNNGLAVIATLPAGYSSAVGTAIVKDPVSGDYFVGGVACGSNCLSTTTAQPIAQFVARVKFGNGALDTTYGAQGFAVAFAPQAIAASVEGIALDGAGHIVIGGAYTAPATTQSTGYVARLTPTGTPDPGFGTTGVVQGSPGSEIVDVATDSGDRVYALDRSAGLRRLLAANGAPDVGYSSGPDVQALNGSGSAWQSLQFADSARSSVYLSGGAANGCTGSCATTALLARVILFGGVSTTTLIASTTRAPFSQPVTFTATVSGSNPTGTVTFRDGSTTLGTASVASGAATFTSSTLAVGSHSITATYGGDPSNGPSVSAAVIVTIDPVSIAPSTTGLMVTPAMTTFGKPILLTATVTGNSPTGTVTFYDAATALAAAPLAGGVATFATSALAVGDHSFTAVYGGDIQNGSSTSPPVSATVNAVPPSTTSLTVTPATTTVGQPVTLTATVAGASPTGTVTFNDGSTPLAAIPLSGGIATFTTSALALGAHGLAAMYSGDANNDASTSPVVTATVNIAANSTALTAMPAATSVGQLVTLTATVTGGLAPTGTVTFYDGAMTLGTATLNGGTATYTAMGLAQGGHAITAVYSGNANNAPSSSAVVTETVNAAPGRGGGGGAFDVLALCGLLLVALARAARGSAPNGAPVA